MKLSSTSAREVLFAPRSRFYAMALFLVSVFAMGGGSRGDIQSLMLLRPLAAGFFVYGALCLERGDWLIFRPLFWLLGSLVLLIWIQLIPLPPDIWASLPKRDVTLPLLESVGLADAWRPLSFSPARSWNAFFSLIVPAAALALFAAQTNEYRKRTLLLLLGLGIVSALVGVFQVLQGPDSPLYTFDVTSPYAVGLFANRNHQGVYLACMILLAAWWFSVGEPREKNPGVRQAAAISAIVLLVPMIFLAGSRAGLVCGALALMAALIQIARSSKLPREFVISKRVTISSRLLMWAAAGLFAMFAAIVTFSARSLALDRLLADDAVEDLRWQFFPILGDIAADMLPFGTGFGAFEQVYRIYEPFELLRPKYLNQAHSDWMQFIIEGGVPAGLILLGVLALVAVSGWRTLRMQPSVKKTSGLAALGLIGLVAAASIVDYPLRTPIFMATMAIMVATLWISSKPLTSAR